MSPVSHCLTRQPLIASSQYGSLNKEKSVFFLSFLDSSLETPSSMALFSHMTPAPHRLHCTTVQLDTLAEQNLSSALDCHKCNGVNELIYMHV